MADDTTLNPGGGGDTIRDVDKNPGVVGKTQVVIIDMGGGGAENLAATPATQATAAALLAELLLKAKLTDTQPVSAASLPLPTGAALEAAVAALQVELKAEQIRARDVFKELLALELDRLAYESDEDDDFMLLH